MQFFITQYNPPPVPTPPPNRQLNTPVFYEQYQNYFRDFYTGLVEWTRSVTKVINTGTQGVGDDIPAATAITVSAYQHVITGTAAIQNIFTVPNLPASHLTLISTNGFSLITGGNISLGRNVQAGQAVMLVWGPVDQIWYPIISTADTGDVPEAPGFFFVSAIDVNRRALIDFTQPGHIGEVLPQLYDYTATWQALHVYTVPTYITDSNGKIQQLITAGTSGGSTPTWSATLHGLTVDGTAEWENVGGSGAASIILQSPKYLLVETHQATPAEIRFATAAGAVVSKITKGPTAATDLALIPATTGVGTLALGDSNTWSHIKLLAATDVILQAATVQLTATLAQLIATTIQLQATTNQIQGAVELTNTVTKYKNIATVSNGVPAEYAQANLTGQTAAIAATTLYAVPADGLYRVSYAAKLTTVGSVSSVLGGVNGFQVIYTDADDSVVVTTPAGPVVNLNTTQAQVSGVIVVNAKAGSNLQFSFGYTSVNASEMTYALHVKLEAL